MFGQNGSDFHPLELFSGFLVIFVILMTRDFFPLRRTSCKLSPLAQGSQKEPAKEMSFFS